MLQSRTIDVKYLRTKLLLAYLHQTILNMMSRAFLRMYRVEIILGWYAFLYAFRWIINYDRLPLSLDRDSDSCLHAPLA